MRLTLALCFVASLASAQTISGVTGTFTYGSPITIAGLSFGTKSTAAPTKWENFQSGTLGAKVSTSGASGTQWLDTANHTAHDFLFNNTNMRPGTPFTQHGRAIWIDSEWGSGDPSSSSIQLVDSFPPDGHVSIDAHLYMDRSSCTDCFSSPRGAGFNSKFWRMHNDDVSESPNIGFVMVQGDIIIGGDGQNPDDTCCDYWNTTNGDLDLNGATHMSNRWVHWGWQLGMSSAGSANGSMRATFQNSTTHSVYNTTGRSWLVPGSNGLELLYIGNYTRNDSEWDGTFRVYWESVYIDKSWARVVISNNATLASATAYEMCIPSAWSATSVTCTLNRGDFATNASVFVHICTDATAATCRAGYNITLGGVGSATGPVRLRPIMLLAALIPFWSLRQRALLIPHDRGRKHEERLTGARGADESSTGVDQCQN